MALRRMNEQGTQGNPDFKGEGSLPSLSPSSSPSPETPSSPPSPILTIIKNRPKKAVLLHRYAFYLSPRHYYHFDNIHHRHNHQHHCHHHRHDHHHHHDYSAISTRCNQLGSVPTIFCPNHYLLFGRTNFIIFFNTFADFISVLTIVMFRSPSSSW